MNNIENNKVSSRYIVTRHGYDRMKERLGLGKKACERMSEKVYNEGISFTELDKGQLKEYLYVKEELAEAAKCFRIYGQSVYCYATKQQKNGILQVFLVTVFPVPKRLRNTATIKQKSLRMVG